MEFKITPLTIEHYEGMLALWRACEGVGLSEADSRQSIESHLDHNPGMSFVATTEDRLIGVVLAGHDGGRGYIHHLAVHPDCRRRGIGRELVERCLQVLKHAGIRRCHVLIFNHNTDGMAFWESAGWRPRGDICVASKTIVPGAESDC